MVGEQTARKWAKQAPLTPPVESVPNAQPLLWRGT